MHSYLHLGAPGTDRRAGGYVRLSDLEASAPARLVASQIAIIRASVTSWAVIAALIDHPTTRRKNRSITAAT